MKKTNTQFVVVFAGVLILHLAVTTALMRSAHTDGTGFVTSTPDPYYHSSPEEPKKSPGWGTTESRQVPQNSIAPPEIPSNTEENGSSIPDSFAGTTGSAESTTKYPAGLPPKALPVKEKPPTPIKKIEPVPEAPTRRLTVTQLLTPEPKAAPADDGVSPANPGGTASGPKVKPLPPVTESNSGPRKIRSLSGD